MKINFRSAPWLVSACLLWVFLAGSSPVEAAAAVVHSCKQDAGGTTAACTLSGVTAGNMIVAFCITDNGGSANISVADDKTNTYTERAEDDTTPGILVATATAGSSGNTVVTCAFGSNFTAVLVAEVAGVSSFDQVGTINSATSTTPSASVSLSANGIVIAGMAVRAGGSNTAGSGYTMPQSIDSYANINGALEYKTGAAGAYAPDWTASGSAAWRAVAVSLLESGGGAGTTRPCTLSLLGVGC